MSFWKTLFGAKQQPPTAPPPAVTVPTPRVSPQPTPPSARDLFDAAKRGDATSVQALLTRGASVNTKQTDGQTALIAAAAHSHVECVKALIFAGADVNAKNNNGQTAFMFAAVTDAMDNVKALITAGADVNAKDKDDWTALMYAAGRKGTTENVKALIAAGADVNAKAKDEGATALMMAAKDGETGSVNALIAAGAAQKAMKPENMFSRATLMALGTGSGDAEADERLIGKIIKAFNYLYSTNVQPGDFSIKFGGTADAKRSFVLKMNVPIPATTQLGEEMVASLEELLHRNGLR